MSKKVAYRLVAFGVLFALLSSSILPNTSMAPAYATSHSSSDRYTLLKYSGVIDMSAEYKDFDRKGELDYRVSVSTKVSFTVTLDHPDGDYGLSASQTVRITGISYSGDYWFRDYQSYSSSCTERGPISGTFTFELRQFTTARFESSRIELSTDLLDWVETATTPSCMQWKGRHVLIDALGSCLGYYSSEWFPACADYSILGSTTPLKGEKIPRISPGVSYSGSAGLTLVESKKHEPFDFSITVTPDEIKVTKGQSATYTVKVSHLKGEARLVSLSGLVDLSPTIYGPLVFATGIPLSGKPFETKFTIPATQTQSAKIGKYYVWVLGDSGGLSRDGNVVTLAVRPGPSWLPSDVDVKDDTVNLANLASPLKDKLATIGKIFQEEAGRNAVITSGSDGTHGSTSLHPSGNAIDLRTEGISYEQLKKIMKRLVDEWPYEQGDIGLKLRSDAQIERIKREISERIFKDPGRNPHIHIEYQPRTTIKSAPQQRLGDVKVITGDVDVKRNNERSLLSNGVEIGAGDTVKTGKSGSIRMGLLKDSYIDQGSSTTLYLKPSADPGLGIELEEGKIHFGTGSDKQTNPITVEAEGISIRPRGTDFIVEVDNDLKVTVVVLHGSLEVKDKNGQTALVSDNQILIIPDAPAEQTSESLEKRITQLDPNTIERWWPALPDTTTTLTIPSNMITYGQSITLTGTLTPTESTGKIIIQHSRDQKTWTDITTISPTSGSFSFDYAPDITGTHHLRAVYPGEGRFPTSTSQTVTFNVQPKTDTFKVAIGTQQFTITTLSNSTLTGFQFDQTGKSILFTITGTKTRATIGVIEVTYPSNLLSGTLTVTLDNAPLQFKQAQSSTHITITVSYPQTSTPKTLRITGTVTIPDSTQTTTTTEAKTTTTQTEPQTTTTNPTTTTQVTTTQVTTRPETQQPKAEPLKAVIIRPGLRDLVVILAGDVNGGERPYSFLWSFGDGQSSREEVPLHKYNKSGRYVVTLTVTDAKQNTTTYTQEVVVTKEPSSPEELLLPVSGAAMLALILAASVLTVRKGRRKP